MIDSNRIMVKTPANSAFMPELKNPNGFPDGFRTSEFNTNTVVTSTSPFVDLAAAARAAAELHLSIAKKGATEESRAFMLAKAFTERGEKQISALNCIPEVTALLLDLASEPARRKANFPSEGVPDWSILLATRAETALRHMSE